MATDRTSAESLRRASPKRSADAPAPFSLREDRALQVFMFRGDEFMGTELYSTRSALIAGRHPSSAIRLDDESVSRQHCRLSWRQGALRIEDLHSGNGTFVNEQRLTGSQVLGFGDTVRLGAYTLKVRMIESSGPVPFDPIAALATTRIEAVPFGPGELFEAPIPPMADDTETELDDGVRVQIPPVVSAPSVDEPSTSADEARLRDLSQLLESFGAEEGGSATDPDVDSAAAFAEHLAETLAEEGALDAPSGTGAANDDPLTDRIRRYRRPLPVVADRSRSTTPPSRKVRVDPVDEDSTLLGEHGSGGFVDERPPQRRVRPSFHGIEVAARVRGRLVSITVLERPGDEYILGHATPTGQVAPGRCHLGLRLLKINQDRTVDLVFPDDVAGHLDRGPYSVALRTLTEGRKYSCLRLDPADIAAVLLGKGHDRVSYHLRFLKRPASTLRALAQTACP